jgi:hypothetical protein
MILFKTWQRKFESSGITTKSILISYPSIGSSWVQQFIKRHPHLKTTLSQSIEAARIKDVIKDIVIDWFAKLQETMEENQIALENTYNMDETGENLFT